MTYLPIDYYILLQKGYKRKSKKSQGKAQGQTRSRSFKDFDWPRSNMIMFNNLPILYKKSTSYSKKKKIMKAAMYEDVYRCLEKGDAKEMLND